MKNRLLKILVVDDECIIAKVIQGLLEEDGHTVITITEAGAHGFGGTVHSTLAQAELEGQPFDALICDIGLNGENGCSITFAVIQRYADLQVIITSGADSDLLSDELRSRIAGFVPKPFRTGDFAAVFNGRTATAD